MGRGRMGPSGGSSRGGMGSSGGSSRGGFGGSSRVGRSHHRTTVFVGGYHHGHYYAGSGSPWVGIIVGAIFFFVGISVLFGGLSFLFDASKYSTVQAECVLNEKSYGYYYTTYDYTVDGVDYTNRSEQSWEFPEEIGKVVTIYYLESNPNKIYEEIPEDADKSGSTFMIFGGLLFAGVGALTFVLCLKLIKNRKNGDDSSDQGGSLEREEQPENRYDRCPYCGSKYNKNSGSCPKCGAG